MKLSVVVPTYMRPADLKRCLEGLAGQERQADQVIVVVRESDEISADLARSWKDRLTIDICPVQIPGQIQAMNVGLEHVTGDVVSITDDDTFAESDWLARIEKHFRNDSALGGLGGRDIVHVSDNKFPPVDDRVGLILPYGRIIGNHHTGRGAARVVDHLKGVNMSWRMAAIDGRRFDTRLRGRGAQVYNEFGFGLEVQNRGWRLMYDPAVQVHHYPGQRFDSDKRTVRDTTALENSSFNLYLTLRCYMRRGWKRSMALMWARYVGGLGQPGMLRGFWFRLTGNRAGLQDWHTVARAWEDAKAVCP